MPQQIQHSLVCILLMWTTIISIFQVVFIAIFFTRDHSGLSQNSSAVKPQERFQEHSTPPPPCQLVLGKGQMLTFRATKADTSISWTPEYHKEGVISVSKDSEDVLKIMADGYYFLNLRVTLSSSRETGGSQISTHTVSIEFDDGVLLTGWINTKTNGTVLLSKVGKLYSAGRLKVTIDPPATSVNCSVTVTHLDIIYMALPQS